MLGAVGAGPAEEVLLVEGLPPLVVLVEVGTVLEVEVAPPGRHWL